jgi:putative tryptophan/tyrosine transport system substrate-binding protein
MRRRDLLAAAAATAWPGAPSAQNRRVPVVGILTNTSIADMRVLIVPETLRQRGYVDGQNVRYEFRFGEGRTERLPDLAKELVAVEVDAIVAAGTPAIKAAQQATTTIPIVGVAMADPVRDGLVRNYSAPESNITGNTFLGPDLVPKRLGYLKELLPTISRVHVLWHPDAYSKQTMDDMVTAVEEAAATMKLRLEFVAAAHPAEFAKAFGMIANDRPEALLEFPSPMFYAGRQELVRLADMHRIPTIWNTREFVELGGLIMYGTSLPDLSRQAAVYVDKLIKGAKPSELPVEQPTKFELMLNVKTARTLGITIPPTLLARADEVIE